MTCTGMAFFPTNFLLPAEASHEDDHHTTPHSLSPILQDFHGKRSSSMVYAQEVSCDQETNININGDEELSDDGLVGGEKKKRLNMDQVKTLERNFELGNKLDPERKMQLARALGMQPRQIAIWFQNRRARSKTKQLEKDYDVLKKQFEVIKAQNDSLLSQNHKLHAEIMALKNKQGGPTESINLNIKETTEGSCSNRSENSNSDEIKLDISRTTEISSISSHHHHQQHQVPNLFQSSIVDRSSHHQMYHNSSSSIRPEYHQYLQAQKMDQSVINNNNNNNNVKEESFSNMFVGMEDQSGFWPWLDQQPHFN